jgi:hypothetical protein
MDTRNKSFKQKANRFLRRVVLAPLAVFMGVGMDDILSGAEPMPEPEPEPEPEPTPEPEPEPTPEPEPAPKPEPSISDEIRGLKAAEAAERRKRQEREAELAAANEELERLRQEEKPFLGEEYEARFNEVEARVEERITQNRIIMSREFAMEKYDDFAGKEAAFLEMADKDPGLIPKMRASANPAAFAYKTVTDAQRIQKLQEMGDPAELEAKIYERVKAELLAEQEKEKAAVVEAAIKSKLKGGFSEQRSVGTERTTSKKFDGPTPMKSILG